MKNASLMTAAIFGSLAAAGLGIAATSTAAPAPEGTPDAPSACDALAGAGNDASAAVNKIHDIGPTISPALPHPDNPELQTGQVNIIQLFLQSRDISGSLRHASGSLRGAEGNVDNDALRDAADGLAQTNDDTAASFDTASNILSRPPMEEAAPQIMQHVGDTMNAFHHFNDLYSAQCGVDLRPDWDNPSAAAAEVDDEAPPADDQAPPADEDQAPPADDQAAPADDPAPPADDQAPPADDPAPPADGDTGQ